MLLAILPVHTFVMCAQPWVLHIIVLAVLALGLPWLLVLVVLACAPCIRLCILLAVAAAS